MTKILKYSIIAIFLFICINSILLAQPSAGFCTPYNGQVFTVPSPGQSYTVPCSLYASASSWAWKSKLLFYIDNNKINEWILQNGGWGGYNYESLSLGTHILKVDLIETDFGGSSYTTATQTITIYIKNTFNVTIVNSYGGSLIVDGTTFGSSTACTWVQGTSHTLQALFDLEEEITTMHLLSWSSPTGTLPAYNPIIVTASSNGTYKANIEGEYISGPGSLGFKQSAIYSANNIGGSGSFTYQWYKKDGSTWSAVPGGTARTQNFTMINSDIPIRVDVHDNGAGASLSAYFTIYYGMEKNGRAHVEIPSCFALSNYPNPFNPSTVINYQLPAASSVKLSVYDMLGCEVAALVDGIKDAGYYTATFDGSKLTSGVYFTRMIATPIDGNQPSIQTMKMILAK